MKGPKSICPAAGCFTLTEGGRCDVHKRQPWQRKPDTRPSAAKRGYGRKWAETSKAYLAAHPLCAECERHGVVKAAEHTDHVIPHDGDMTIFWDSDNWEGLCASCHSKKTLKEQRMKNTLRGGG